MKSSAPRHTIPIGRLTSALLLGGALSGLIAVPHLVDAEQAGREEMITLNGYTDWGRGVVVAKGLGVPPKNPANALQAKEMTRTAAWSVALRNLLEVVRGIRVDATTTVSNFVTVNDEVRTRVEGLVRGAKVVQEKWLPDGSLETTVEMKLGGDFSGLLLPKGPPRMQPLDRFKDGGPPSKKPANFTGVIVDARGMGVTPAIAPRLLTEAGDEAYSATYVEERPVAEQGIALYLSDWDGAQVHPRIASTPMTIKALRVEGNNRTDLVIADADAQLIHMIPEHFQLLKQAKVLIILDQP